MGDATFWALVALIIFLAVVVYLKVPGMIGKSLDDRAEKIRNELEEARKLREEAQALLAEYQKKRKEAEKEAGDIVEAGYNINMNRAVTDTTFTQQTHGDIKKIRIAGVVTIIICVMHLAQRGDQFSRHLPLHH